MSTIYFAIPTDAGQAKIANALALGVPLKITHMAVGDGNGQPVTPNAAQTALVREKRRAPINTLFQDPTNQSQLVAEQIIPEDVGDWWIREIGVFSEDGTLVAIANCPDTYKPLLSSGAGRTQVIRIVLIVSDTSAVELKIDPSVVLATRKYVDDQMGAELAKLDSKQSVRAATTAAITLTAPQTVDGVALVTGDRVLVKDQNDAKQNGIYLVATGSWTRTTDADTGTDLTPGARVYVEEGTVNATQVWYLATTGTITLGTTMLTFKNEHPAASENMSGVMKVATQVMADEGLDDSAAITSKKLAKRMQAQASGRLLGVQVFTSSGTYTPTPGTKSIVVECLGAGGGGGGANPAGAGQVSAGGHGGGGAYAKGRFTAGFEGLAVTIGNGGALGGVGGLGGTTSLGSLISASGGAGGGAGVPFTPPGSSGAAGGGGVNITGGNIVSSVGHMSQATIAITTGTIFNVQGAPSKYGPGPNGAFGNGVTATTKGTGGTGALAGSSTGPFNGGAGAPGILIIWEYL